MYIRFYQRSLNFLLQKPYWYFFFSLKQTPCQYTINLLNAIETINLLMMGGTEVDPGKDANKLTNKATLVQVSY